MTATPRIRSVAAFEKSLGPRAVELAARAGLVADEWQADIVEGLFALGGGDRFLHFEGGLNVARQNGKDGVLEIVELDALFNWPGENLIIHSAHEFATAQEHQLRLEALIQSTPDLHRLVKDRGGYKHANGQESINLKSGSRIIFKARTKGGARGFSADLLIWNEAMVLPEHVVGAMMPTLRASGAPYGPMIIYAGSAVDQEIHEHGVVWARIRERGIAGEPGLAYFEFSMCIGDPRDDHPSLLTEEMLRDEVLWAQANPALDRRVSREHMRLEMASMPARTAAVELGGIGDWPRTDGRVETPIAIEAWDALTDDRSQLQRPFVLAYDVSPERRTAIVAAGRNQHGRAHVEVHEHRPGTSWVPERLEEMVARGEPVAVVCAARGPAASLIVDLEKRGMTVQTVDETEHSQACGRLVDMVEERALAHLGSQEMRDAIRGAKSRPLGDSWAWSRKSSLIDISPLVAGTLGLWAFETAKPKRQVRAVSFA